MPMVSLPIPFCFSTSLNVTKVACLCIRRSPVPALVECIFDQAAYCIEAQRPSHPILTGEVGGWVQHCAAKDSEETQWSVALECRLAVSRRERAEGRRHWDRRNYRVRRLPDESVASDP